METMGDNYKIKKCKESTNAAKMDYSVTQLRGIIVTQKRFKIKKE